MKHANGHPVSTVTAQRCLLGVLVLALVGAAGCAKVVEKGAGLLSSSADAIAVVGGRVLRGDANFARDRLGTVQMQTGEGPVLSCFGSLRYTATSSGTIDMSCNDGRLFVLPFQEISPLSGTARGMAGKEIFSLTYGLSTERAAGYLGVPLDQLAPPKTDSNRNNTGSTSY